MPSTVIQSFAYDEARNELTVRFTTDKVYVYSLVPPAVAAAMQAAFSKGEYFNAHVRDHYPFRKLGSDPGPSLMDALQKSPGPAS